MRDQEKKRVTDRAYYARHRERRARETRERRAFDLEYARSLDKAIRLRRYAEDPEGVRAAWRVAARKWRAGLSEEQRERQRQRQRQRRHYLRRPGRRRKGYELVLLGDPCCYCGGDSQEVDHIEPVGLGGMDGWANQTAACRTCNRRKNAASLLAFLLSRTT